MSERQTDQATLVKMKGLSVVIPTYRRERVLLDTVYHLLAQKLATDVFVVDQTPRHDAHVDSELQRLHDENAVRWIRVGRPSIPWAMNGGLLEVRGCSSTTTSCPGRDW